MKYLIKIITISIILSFLTSCHRDIILKNDYEKDLVLNAFCFPNEKPSVMVAFSAPPGGFDTTYFVNDAEVAIYENDNLVKVLSNCGLGEYSADIVLNENKNYTVKAKYQDREAIGEIKFPKKPAKANIKIRNESYAFVHPYNEKFVEIYLDLDVNITLNDIPERQNYMLVFYAKKPIFEYETYQEDSVIGYSYEPLYFYIASDNLLDDFTIEERFDVGDIPASSRFPYSSYEYIFSDITFSEAAFSFDTSIDFSTLKPNTADEDGKKTDSIVLYYRLVTVSEDWVDFNISKYKYENSVDNPFVEPVSVLTNVKGGLGIVAGFNEIVDSVSHKVNIETDF